MAVEGVVGWDCGIGGERFRPDEMRSEWRVQDVSGPG